MSDSDENEDFYGPRLPSTLCGSKIKSNEHLEKEDSVPEDEAVYGPVLPPSLKSNSAKNKIPESKVKMYGPSLPFPLDNNKKEEKLEINQDSCLENYNSKSENKESDSEDEIYGPLPENKTNLITNELEIRALEMKLYGNSSLKSDKISREEWMLELPKSKQLQALTPRQFSKSNAEKVTENSLWTSIPGEKSKGQNPKTSHLENAEILEKIKTQEKIIKEYEKTKKRNKSLLDLHNESKSKKNKTEDTDKKERRPFDREIDLKTNMMTGQQKKSIIDKAQFLNDRFSTGKSKFL